MTTVKTLTINETLERLRAHGVAMGPEILSMGIEQGAFPFGVCVHKDRRNFFIFERLLDEWIAARAVEVV